MKSLNSFIVICVIGVFFIACEKAEIQKQSQGSAAIDLRADDCDNCTVDDCCCFVELTGGTQSAALTLCGITSPGTSPCSLDLQDPCPEISGVYWTTILSNPANLDEFFCVAKNSSFMLGVGNAPANLRLTCQYGQLGAQVLNLSLSANEKLYFNADGSCSLSSCHPEP